MHTEKEAQEEALRMLEVYRELAEDILAIPVILGEKSAGERFPGAENTYTFEADDARSKSTSSRNIALFRSKLC